MSRSFHVTHGDHLWCTYFHPDPPKRETAGLEAPKFAQPPVAAATICHGSPTVEHHGENLSTPLISARNWKGLLQRIPSTYSAKLRGI
jgi:hypothetical protein